MTMKPHDARKKLMLAEQWDFKCIICGRELETLACITIEHIIPKSKKLKLLDNLAPSHYNCNNFRGAVPLLQAVKLIEKKIKSLSNIREWLRKLPPNRIVPKQALLHPLDAAWYYIN